MRGEPGGIGKNAYATLRKTTAWFKSREQVYKEHQIERSLLLGLLSGPAGAGAGTGAGGGGGGGGAGAGADAGQLAGHENSAPNAKRDRAAAAIDLTRSPEDKKPRMEVDLTHSPA